MKCVVGIDLGSTTTKAVLLDEQGALVGRGITNSRSNYEVACAVARQEALTAARFTVLERALAALPEPDATTVRALQAPLVEAFRLELYLAQWEQLDEAMARVLDLPYMQEQRAALTPAVQEIARRARADAPALFQVGAERKSDFFRDLAGAAYMSAAEAICTADGGLRFDRVAGVFDRAILEVETRLIPFSFGTLLRAAARRCGAAGAGGNPAPAAGGRATPAALLAAAVDEAAAAALDEAAFVGTGYGRQTLPFPKQAVRSEILCHGRGAHRVFPRTRTVLDIGGQDTKAIQVDEQGVVTSFQMNDRCAAGCGRYLGYIADELNLGLHELGPLALQAQTMVKVNSTCTVFAGAELRERLALGQRREDILAGLHRAIMLRAMSLLARSGGVREQFTFTGGVCKNPMATKVLRALVDEHYGAELTLNAHPDSIYMGALGAALFALDDVRAGRPGLLPAFARAG